MDSKTASDVGRDDGWTPRPGALLVSATALAAAIALVVSSTVGNGGATTADPAAPATPAGQQVAAAADPLAAGRDVIPPLTPKADLSPAPSSEVNVAVAPDVPPPSGRTSQAIIDVAFEVVEDVSTIDANNGTRTQTWGYRILGGPGNDVVVGTPGPIIRARVGDVLRFTLTNPADNSLPHNIDLHAVTGQGGGAANTVVNPGETRTIEARLLYPGFFMYHCAFGDVPSHIAHGMYGGILVDPATPLPDVDHEWYVVQSEYYLAASDDDVRGLDRQALSDELPTHVVFNGAVGAIAGDNALQMNVGERARIYFVNAGLNLDSNFHPIGSHWDVVYQEAALLNRPLRGSQTTLVPAGGGTVVELVGFVPSTIILVDHALTRTFDKGALGMVVVNGEEDAEIFEEVEPGDVERPESLPEPDESDEATDEAPDEATASGTTHQVAILAGSGQFQPEDAPDEYAAEESPGDYSQNVLEIAVGDTVTWTNQDADMVHSVTAADGSFDSGLYGSGESWSFTFEQPGEYEYYCIPHPWMRARVVVTA